MGRPSRVPRERHAAMCHQMDDGPVQSQPSTARDRRASKPSVPRARVRVRRSWRSRSVELGVARRQEDEGARRRRSGCHDAREPRRCSHPAHCARGHRGGRRVGVAVIGRRADPMAMARRPASLAALAVRAIAPVLVPSASRRCGRKDFVGLAEYLPQLARCSCWCRSRRPGEEFFYRGTLMQASDSFTRSPAGDVISTARSRRARRAARAAIAIAAIGLACAWLTVRTGGLEACIGHHIVLNTSASWRARDRRAASARHQRASAPTSAPRCQSRIVACTSSYRAASAKRLPAGADQVEQDPPERRVGVEHADHGGDAEPLAPQQQQPRGQLRGRRRASTRPVASASSRGVAGGPVEVAVRVRAAARARAPSRGARSSRASRCGGAGPSVASAMRKRSPA